MRRSAAALALLPLLGLTGCQKGFDLLPQARSLGSMVLMRTMGIDLGETYAVRVTVSSGEQSLGRGEGSEKALVLQKEAESISGACLAMQGQGASYVFYGHVGQLLLGEAAARDGLEVPLDYVLGDIETRLETDVYLVRGAEAGEAIAAAAKEGSATKRLEAVEKDGGLLSKSMTRTAEAALEDLLENGDTFLPALALEGEDREMDPRGYGLVRDWALVDWIQGEEAHGAELLLSEVEADILEVEDPELGKAVLRIVDAKTRVRPVFQGERLTGLTVSCRVEADLAEGAEEFDRPDRRSRLEQAMAERTERRIRTLLEHSQRLEGDFFQLEGMAQRAMPWKKRTIAEQWDLGGLDIRVEARGEILRRYDVSVGREKL